MSCTLSWSVPLQFGAGQKTSFEACESCRAIGSASTFRPAHCILPARQNLGKCGAAFGCPVTIEWIRKGRPWQRTSKPCWMCARFRVVKHSVTRSDGTPASVSYVVHPGSVAILPLVDADHLCLIRSRRLTVGQTLIEVPAGTREPGEPPAETARRELEEETGYRASKWEELTQFYASPGILSERMYVYLASDLTRRGAPPRDERGDRKPRAVMGRGPGDGRPRGDYRWEDNHCADCSMTGGEAAVPASERFGRTRRPDGIIGCGPGAARSAVDHAVENLFLF